MACGRCGEANREDAQFCASCGAALVAPCPSCGALPHGPAARFCDRCGTELAGAGAVAAQARKVVTVLFADLVGSTAAQEQMDPEFVRRWMDRYYAVLRTEVQAQGGRVVKFIGDGMMAVFGMPEVREDDARRALVAAMAMHASVTELGTELATRADVRVGLRVGINTGEVVVAERDDDVVGDVVNVAARLADAAGPGEVLVGETTFRLVRLGAQLRALAPLTLKGKAEPVNAFHLVSLEGRPEVVVTSPFVGRAGDLERLFALLESSLNEKRTNLASIVGSPGVGKTRLARELAARAGDRARVVDVRCDPSGGATFAPIAAAIRLAASLQDDATDDTILAALTALFDESEPERARIASIVAALLGVGEPGLPEETFWAVRRLIENAARVRPLLFLFDDVHWAEPLLLDLIENMAEWVRDVPVLLVVTARPELRDLRPSLVEVGGRVGAAIHLEGLDVDESRRLTRALLEGAALPEALLDRIATASEGNPLFVGELVRMLVDDGALRRDGDRWTATVDLDELEVPVSIHALLAARIDRLPAGERTVLEAASVVGKTFYRGVVAELVDADVRRQLDEHFESLRRKEMVEPTGTYWLDQPVLRFHHVLIRDAAYRRLLKEARATLHERAAEWFEVKVGELVEHDDVIGFQLEQAHLLREELGETDATLGHAASDRLAAAGRRALEADDRPGAAGLLGRAVGCLPADDARRPQLLIDRAEALLAMGDVTDAAPVVDALAAVATGDPRLEAWVTCFAGELANLRDPRHLAKTADEAAAAAEALDELGDDAGVAKAHWVRAASLARLGRIAECEGSLDRALGSARRAGDRRRATAILAGAPTAALWGPNPVTRASGRCLDVVRVLRITSRAPAVEATSLRCQAVLEGLRGRDEAARRMLANARNALEELGHAHGLLELDIAAGMVEMMSGAPAAAERYLRRAHEGFHELGIDVDAGFAAALLARIRIGQGAPDEALELTEESEQLVGDDLKAGIAWRAVRAEALAHAGDLDEARRLAEEAVAMAAPTDALVDHADALLSLAEVRRLAGDATGAAEAAQRALDLYERKEATVSAERARGYLGVELTAAQSQREEASPGVADNDAVRRFRETASLVFGGRLDAARDHFAEDIRSVDHRPLGGPPVSGVDAYLEAILGVLAVGAGDMVITTVETRGERLAVVRCRYLVGDRTVLVDLETLQLIEIDGAGLFVTNDIYELDQLDEARADLDRRAPSAARPELSNMATLAGLAVYEHGLHGRWAEAAALCRPDVTYADHRPLVGGIEGSDRGEYLAAAQSIFASGVMEMSFETLALRGERLGLGTIVYRGQAAEVAALGMLETDEAGLVASVAAYDVDQLAEAQADLERRYADELGEELGEVWLACTRLLAGIVALDWTAMRAALSDDLIGVDHRPLGWGTFDADSYVQLYRTVAELTSDWWHGAQEVLAVTPSGCCVLATGRGTTLDGSEFRTVGVITFRVRDGRVDRVDVFPLDQPELGLACLDADGAVPAYPYEPSNAATVAAREIADLGLAERWEEATARLHPEIQFADHRPIVGGVSTSDRDTYLEVAHGIVDTGVQDVQARFLAVRGERLALGTGLYLGRRSETEIVAVVEFDEQGLATAVATYDVDQLADAQAELERRYAEQLGEELGAVWLACTPMFAGMVAHDWDALRATLAEDFVLIDHRPLGWGTVDRDAFIELYRVPSAPDTWFGSPEVYAVTGSGVCCHGEGRGTTADGAEFRTGALMALRVTDGRIDRAEYFAVDDIDAGLACLHGFAGGSPLENAATRAAQASVAAVLLGDWEAFESMTSDDAIGVDHRALVGSEIVGLDALVDVNRGLVDIGVTSITFSPVAIDGDRWALQRASFKGPSGDWSVDVLHLAGVDTNGLIHRGEIFDLDHLDLALARLAELSGSGTASTDLELENEASRAYDAIWQRMLARDRAALMELLHEDAVCIDRRPLVGGDQEFVGPDAIDWIMSVVEAGVDTRDPRVVAVRGEHLAVLDVFYSGPQGGIRVGHVVELDASGLMRRSELFDPEQQLPEAIARIDELYGESLDEGRRSIWERLRAFIVAFGANDLQAMTALIHPDLAMVDHRPASFGTETWSTWADVFGTEFGESTGTWLLARSVLGLSGSTCFTSSEVRGTRDGGAFVNPMLIVAELRDGLLLEGHLYEPEDRAAAEAKFAELSDRPHETTVRRTWLGYVEMMRRFDREGLIAGIRPTARIVDHRSLVGGVEMGPDRYQAMVDAFLALGRMRIESTQLAARGDLLELNRTWFQTDEDAEMETLHVLGTDQGGGIALMEVFDLDQLDEAFVELDARWVASLPPAEAEVARVGSALVDAQNRRDVDAVDALLASAFTIDDHRPLSGGVISRADQLQTFRPVFDASPDVRWRGVRVLGIWGRGIYGEMEMRGTRDGGAFSSPFLAIVKVGHETVTGLEVFPVEDPAAADARFAELVAEDEADAGRLEIENLACRMLRLVNEQAIARRWEAVAERVHPDIIGTDRRPLVGGLTLTGRDAYLEFFRSVISAGVTRASVEALAQRGERLALVDVVHGGSAGELESLQVLELDEADNLVAHDLFEPEQIQEAFELLDERYRATLAPDDLETMHVIMAARDALNAKELDPLRDLMPPEMIWVDHRLAAYGAPESGTWLTVFEELFADSPDGWWLTRKALGLERGVFYSWTDIRGSLDGSDWVVPMLIVTSVRDGRYATIDFYEIEDLAAADARFAELVAERAENLAVRAFDRSIQLNIDRRVDELVDQYAVDVIARDHRPVIGGVQLEGRDEVKSLNTALEEWKWDRVHREVVDQRGDRCALLHATLGDESAEVSVLVLQAVDDDGRIASIDLFDPDQLDAARAALDDISGEERTLFERGWDAFRSAAERGDLDALLDLMGPDASMTDRRPLIGGLALTGDEMRRAIEAFVDLAPMTIDWTLLSMRGDRLGLGRSRFSGRGAEVDALMVAEVDEQGKVGRIVNFDTDQLGEARAELDDWFLAGEGAAHADVWRIAETFRVAVNSHDVARVDAAVQPDFVVVDHRLLGWGQLDRSDYLSAQATLSESSPDHELTMVRDLGASGACVYGRFETRGTQEGGEFVIPFLVMGVVRDGLVERIEIFAPEDRAAADARFAELSAGQV